jgi:hypothetical protein
VLQVGGDRVRVGRIERVQSSDEQVTPVETKAVLVDPRSMTVVWMNESAARDFPGRDDDPPAAVTIEEALPMTGVMGVPEAMRAVADTGVAQHLRIDVVSTARGSVALVASIYRLPDGHLLVLTENAWHLAQAKVGKSVSKKPGRRAR